MPDEFRQLENQTLSHIILGLVIASLVSGLVAVWYWGILSPWFLRAMALLTVALIAFALQKSGRFVVAAYVLVLELIGIVAGMFLQPNAISGFTPYLFIPLIIIAGLILTPTAIVVIGLFSTALTLAMLIPAAQLTPANLLALLPPFGLIVLTTLLMVGNVHYRIKLGNLLQKDRKLSRERTLDMLEAQDKAEALHHRLVELQQQLAQANTETDHLNQVVVRRNGKLYRLAHDAVGEVKVLVSALENVVERLAWVPQGSRADILGEAWQTIDSLASVVVSLEELVKLENGEIELNYQMIDVARLIRELAGTARGLVGEKNLRIHYAVPPDLPPLQADPDRMRQAVLYLLNNALKYSDEGIVDIQAELTDQEIRIVVSDSGAAMVHEEKERILDMPGRLPPKQFEQWQGTSLGLAISKHIVELHQGRTWSTGRVGAGSTFYLALPLAPFWSNAGTEGEAAASVSRATSLAAVEEIVSAAAAGPNLPASSVTSAAEQRPISSRPGRGSKPPVLSPVARFSPIYVARFGLTLLGLLVFIIAVAGILAMINLPNVDIPTVNESNVVAPAPGVTVEAALPPQHSIAALTEVRSTSGPEPVVLPTTRSTAASTETRAVAPTNTPATGVLALSPTPSSAPTHTFSSPSPSPTPRPILPPTTTAVRDNTTVVPAALIQPSAAPSLHLSFAVGTETVTVLNLERQVETAFTIDLHTAENSRLAWSPDGQYFLFTGEQDGNRDIYLAHRSAGLLRNLTQSPADDHQASWSPDGQKIVFSSGRSGNFDIYLMDIEGHNVVQLTTSRGFDEWPVWSPDNKKIAFLSDRDGGNVDIYTMNADGSQQQRLTQHPADDGPVDWSPDGRQLLFASNRDSNFNLYLLNSDGGALLRLTSEPGNEAAPVWSPDGRTIAFVFDGTGGRDIYTLTALPRLTADIPRRSWTQITDTPADEHDPVWLPE